MQIFSRPLICQTCFGRSPNESCIFFEKLRYLRILKLLELSPGENDDWGEDINLDTNLYVEKVEHAIYMVTKMYIQHVIKLETKMYIVQVIEGDEFTQGRKGREEAIQRSIVSARVMSARSR